MRRARLLRLCPRPGAGTGRTLPSQCRHASDQAAFPHEPFQTPATIISQDGTRTLRTRKYGNKPLPIPPILDPIALRARDKHKLPKQRHTQTRWSRKEPDPSVLTPFQRELALNPHARALATPIRVCALSRARLPRQLLLPFGLFAPSNKSDSTDSTEKTGAAPEKPSYKLLTAQMGPHPKGMIGQASYVQATYATVQALGEKRGKVGRWIKLANQAAKIKYAKMTKRAGEGSVTPAKEWQWDVNMPELVLEAMRKDTVEALSTIANKDLLKHVSCVDSEAVAAVVRLVTSSGGPSMGGVAEYDLTKLCGEAYALRLLKDTDMHDGQVAIVKDLRSVDALMALEKLRNYTES